jgi:hypothetical protein
MPTRTAQPVVVHHQLDRATCPPDASQESEHQGDEDERQPRDQVAAGQVGVGSPCGDEDREGMEHRKYDGNPSERLTRTVRSEPAGHASSTRLSGSAAWMSGPGCGAPPVGSKSGSDGSPLPHIEDRASRITLSNHSKSWFRTHSMSETTAPAVPPPSPT